MPWTLFFLQWDWALPTMGGYAYIQHLFAPISNASTDINSFKSLLADDLCLERSVKHPLRNAACGCMPGGGGWQQHEATLWWGQLARSSLVVHTPRGTSAGNAGGRRDTEGVWQGGGGHPGGKPDTWGLIKQYKSTNNAPEMDSQGAVLRRRGFARNSGLFPSQQRQRYSNYRTVLERHGTPVTSDH